MVKVNNLYTPALKCGVLPGITREEVMRLAKISLKIKVNEGFLKMDTLYSADEAFLTNSLAGIVPLVKVDSRVIGEGRPGPVTKRLMELLEGCYGK